MKPAPPVTTMCNATPPSNRRVCWRGDFAAEPPVIADICHIASQDRFAKVRKALQSGGRAGVMGRQAFARGREAEREREIELAQLGQDVIEPGKRARAEPIRPGD